MEKLILAITILVLLVILVNFLYSLDKKDKNNLIDYKKNNIEEMLSFSSEVNDRAKYFELSSIIIKYINSFNLEINASSKDVDYNNIDYTIENYYITLDSSYKKHIDISEYLEISKNMCNKFVKRSKDGEYILVDNDIIEKIYFLSPSKYGMNMYICKLKTIQKNTNSYIGISLKENSKTFKIFYLE